MKAERPARTRRLSGSSRNASRSLAEIVAVDVFCGVGGLTHGLQRAGVNVVAGIDVDAHCRFPYEENNSAKFLQRDIRQLSAHELAKLYGDAPIRLLAGCAPCQPFSTYARSRPNGDGDRRWELLAQFGALVEATSPELITMENVPQLADHNVFREFVKQLKGYHTWHAIVDCSDYGVPQSRKRLVLLASKLGPISLSNRSQAGTDCQTVRTTIGDLPPIGAGGSDPNDPMHRSSALSTLNRQRIRASVPGGSWRDWPTELRTNCHSKESGSTYPSVYGRMVWDEPAPTITTQCFGYGNGRFGHPEQDRAISLREAALLQTFPRGYAFAASDSGFRFAILGRLIGNAVPVRLGEAIGVAFVEHVTESKLRGDDLYGRKVSTRRPRSARD
jgi:DNA (cytosine-5)-methyltransferase 1